MPHSSHHLLDLRYVTVLRSDGIDRPSQLDCLMSVACYTPSQALTPRGVLMSILVIQDILRRYHLSLIHLHGLCYRNSTHLACSLRNRGVPTSKELSSVGLHTILSGSWYTLQIYPKIKWIGSAVSPLAPSF